MTAAVKPALDSTALAPVRATLRAAFGIDHLAGLAPGLLVTDPIGWLPATTLTDGSRMPELLGAAARRWRAAPHAAAALAWKSYCYWLALPAVLGWASARRVPLVHPGDVLVHVADHRPVVTLGLRRTIRVAVLPSDPLAMAGSPAGRNNGAVARRPRGLDLANDSALTGGAPGLASGPRLNGSTRLSHAPSLPRDAGQVVVVPDEAALLSALRASLLDAHLTPLLEQVRNHVRLGSRTLLGSLASGIAHGIIRSADALPGSTVGNIGTLLDALDVADLIDLVPGPAGELTVQRKTCCLAFTLPEPKVCAGCCIRQS